MVNVVLPYTVEAIGHKAFYECSRLALVNFGSYYAPILEEEYDVYYFYEGTNMPILPEYNKDLGISGSLGIINYFMWNVTSDPTNIFYGANFIDYVGKVQNKAIMVMPSNGVGYDSFIFNQYFDVKLKGASAADDTTLAAIKLISKIPENSGSITLAHKDTVAAAKAAYDKIVSDEQRALIPTSLLTVLKNAVQMIEDLEYLEKGDENNENNTEKEDTGRIQTALTVLIVIVSLLALAVITLGIFIFIFVRKLKKGEINIAGKKSSVEEASEETLADYTDSETAEYTAYEPASQAKEELSEAPIEKAPEKPFKKEILDKPVNYDDITEGFETKPASLIKRRIILISCAVLASIAIIIGIVVAIVNANKTYFDTYEKEGYTVSVVFDSNGGTFKGSKSSIVDLFRPEDAIDGSITLLAPDDVRRDKNNVMQVTNPGYFLAGWYTERTPIDENNPDAGYTYSGKWDFESNKLRISSNTEYSVDEPALTLYAAWVPYYNFEIYTTDENGNSYLLSTVSDLNLTIPEWHDGDVTLGMDNFPVRDGYTLVSVDYTEAGVIETQTEKKKFITGKWDEKTATSLTPTIKLYTEWKEGKTYKIHSASDLIKNADLNGYYELYADLDFKDLEWPTTFLNGEFNGKIFGKNHTVSNVSFDSTSRSRISNGLFASLGENAYIENVNFANVTHTIDLSDVVQDANFGLLSGSAKDGAGFKNVTVSGSLVFGDNCSGLIGRSDFTVKTVIASGDTTGITAGKITVVKKNEGNTGFNLKTEADGNISIVSGS